LASKPVENATLSHADDGQDDAVSLVGLERRTRLVRDSILNKGR
jgi:hypothetical protein